MNLAPLAADPPAALSCRIDASDVEAMLDAYDSGMCDASTANCLSRAVSRALRSDQVFPLISQDENRAELDLGGQRVPVSAEVLAWLHAAETGANQGSLEFVIELPPSPRAARREAPKKPSPPRRLRAHSAAPPLAAATV